MLVEKEEKNIFNILMNTWKVELKKKHVIDHHAMLKEFIWDLFLFVRGIKNPGIVLLLVLTT